MSTDNRKRVYYHETRDVCDGLPDLLSRFPLRALIVARPGERVVLPAGRLPEELHLLNRLGFGPYPADVIFVRDDGTIVDGDRNLEGAVLMPFSGTSVVARRFAERHGCSFHAPERDICMDANSKSTFQDVVNELGAGGTLIGPVGSVVRRDGAAACARAIADDAGRAIVKGPHSASGLQQVIVDSSEIPDLSGLPDEVVVQQWVEHDYSPSLQCRIDPDGTIRMLSTTVQILDGTHHIGNRCPSDLPLWVDGAMRWRGKAVCAKLAARGYWGVCGVDFLVREADETVLANEVNARIPAPWYPWTASRRIFGRPLSFRMKSVKLAAGVTVGDIERVMGRLLFDRATRTGFVPFCFVAEHGFVYGVTYAPSVTSLDTLTTDVDARLRELAP